MHPDRGMRCAAQSRTLTADAVVVAQKTHQIDPKDFWGGL